MIIGVIGGRQMTPEIEKAAQKLGELIAQRNHILVSGGLGGVMEAASRGAKSKNGLTIGILPGRTKSDANKYVDIPIVTSMSHARNAIIVRTSDALVAVGGSYGTLSEIALAKAIGKIVVGIKTWDIEGIIKLKTPEEAINYLESKAK